MNNLGSSSGLILASASKHRARLMEKAGLIFDVIIADIDERTIEQPLKNTGLEPPDIAQVLAEAKALEVSRRYPAHFVIGCDQTLSLDGLEFHKPEDMAAARRHLLQMSGKTHQLNAAIVLAMNGETIWRHVGIANIRFRKLTPQFIGRYLAGVGNEVLSSVGAYQIEGRGVQLFDQIEGDYFTVIGLPLLPLLKKLRELGIIDG